MKNKKPLFRDSHETYQSDADLEFTSTENMTQPDESFTIQEILTRFRAGIIDDIRYQDDDYDTDSFDDVDIYRTDGADISDVYNEQKRFEESLAQEEVRGGQVAPTDITQADKAGAPSGDAGTSAGNLPPSAV